MYRMGVDLVPVRYKMSSEIFGEDKELVIILLSEFCVSEWLYKDYLIR